MWGKFGHYMKKNVFVPSTKNKSLYISPSLIMSTQTRKKVLISGYFNSLHSGHIGVFEEASKLGDLYVNIYKNDHSSTFATNNQLYMIKSIKYIHHVQFSTGNFQLDLDTIKPDILYINKEDNILSTIQNILSSIKASNIETIPYVIHQPKISLNPKLISEKESNYLIPWRLCVSGGWLDQPWVSKILSQNEINPLSYGSVIVINVNYNVAFKIRSGLATSTRKVAMKLWEDGIFPQHLNNIEIARLLFGAENPPGTKYVSGSQDHLGLLLPGINRLDYNGKYWPMNIKQLIHNNKYQKIYKFVENVLWCIPLRLRPKGFNPLAKQFLTVENIEILAKTSQNVWNAIINCDKKKFGKGLTDTLKAYKLILPMTVPQELDPIWKKYDKENYGCSFSGAGGGGILMVVADKKPAENAFQIQINNKSWWNKINKQFEIKCGINNDDDEKRNERNL
eukprot:26167_1